ncbi:MAG: hypothetical protein R2690_05695 [Acidimicrobiales bacterium]
MERLVIRPTGPLSGTVPIGGAKNSVLKLMAATLLAEGTFVLRNVPDITDVACMADVLRAMGITVDRSGAGEVTIVRPATDDVVTEAPYELVERMRASTAVLGPLVARFGRARWRCPEATTSAPARSTCTRERSSGSAPPSRSGTGTSRRRPIGWSAPASSWSSPRSAPRRTP